MTNSKASINISQAKDTEQASDFVMMCKERCRKTPPSPLPLAPTCVDGLDVSLQVAVDGENLVAAWVGARPLSHLLMVLLDMLLRNPSLGVKQQKKSVTIYLQKAA